MATHVSNDNDNERFEGIVGKIPRYPLAQYPTPLIKAENLHKIIGGPEIWFKRDDLVSFGLGGNKVRGLEVMLADAFRLDSDTLITGAGVLSNHVRATAATAAYAGLHCIAIYWGDQPAHIDGNYRLTRMLGAEIRFTHNQDRASVDAVTDKVADEVKSQGKQPYPIPRGGACPMGALGHVLAVRELEVQCRQMNFQPDAIIMASGSGGTYAGWLLGLRLLKLPWRIESFTVSRDPDEISRQVARLATETSTLLGLDWTFSNSECPVHGGFIGDGYGIPSAEGAAAIRTVGRAEGLLLDPTYTGKAMAGYLSELMKGRLTQYQRVVFIHTGGEPAFFAGNGKWLNE